ncbi:MAG: nitrate reductase [Acidobacteria bacterium]|nr:MAG: nitrate reductase [Acidobacteriota bacterium]
MMSARSVPPLVAFAFALLLAACAVPRTEPPASPASSDTGGIDVSAIGLRQADVLENPPAADIEPVTAEPGESARRPRPYAIAPPVIPHSVDGLLPITREENACLGCHDPEMAEDMEAPAVPASHFVEPGTLDGRRWPCVACHTPQTTAKPLVANGFQP